MERSTWDRMRRWSSIFAGKSSCRESMFSLGGVLASAQEFVVDGRCSVVHFWWCVVSDR